MFVSSTVVCVLLAFDTTAFPDTVPPLPLPPSVASVLRTLNDLDSDAAARLFDRPRLRPFLLDAALGTDPPTGKGFREAYALHLADLNGKRVPRWRKAGRLDLIAEAGVVGMRSRSAKADPFVAELTDMIRDVVGEKLPPLLAKKLPGGKEEAKEVMAGLDNHALGFLRTFPPFVGLEKQESPEGGGTVTYNGVPNGLPVQWKNGDVRTNISSFPAVCLADRIRFPNYALHYKKAYVVADEFVGVSRVHPSRDFEHTLLVSNGPVNLTGPNDRDGIRFFSASAVVADGDVDLNSDWHRAAVVIARGDIRLRGALTHELSLFVAGGSVSAKSEGAQPSCVVLAKSGITVGDEKKAEPNKPVGTQMTGIGPAELGLRWFEVADVGLEVGTDGKRPVVKAVTKDSPFRGRVEPDDVLRSINDTPVRTVDELRRALRRAVVLGAAVVEFDRGTNTFWRVVRIEDVMR